MKHKYLRQLLEWQIEIEHGWSLPTGALGKGLKKHLSPETWAQLEACYAGAGLAENWAALTKDYGAVSPGGHPVGDSWGTRIRTTWIAASAIMSSRSNAWSTPLQPVGDDRTRTNADKTRLVILSSCHLVILSSCGNRYPHLNLRPTPRRTVDHQCAAQPRGALAHRA